MALSDIISSLGSPSASSPATLNLLSPVFENTAIAKLVSEFFSTQALSLSGITAIPVGSTTNDGYTCYTISDGTVSLFGQTLNVEQLMLLQKNGANQVDFILQFSLSDFADALPYVSSALSEIAPSGVDLVFSTIGGQDSPITFAVSGRSIVQGLNVHIDDNSASCSSGLFYDAAQTIQLIPGLSGFKYQVKGDMQFTGLVDLYTGPSLCDISINLSNDTFSLGPLSVGLPRFTIMSEEAKMDDGSTYHKITNSLVLDLYKKGSTTEKVADIAVEITNSMTLWSFDINVNTANILPQPSGSDNTRLSGLYDLFPSGQGISGLLSGLSFLESAADTILYYADFSGFNITMLLGSSPQVLRLSAGVSLNEASVTAHPITFFNEVQLDTLNVNWSMMVQGSTYFTNIDFNASAGFTKYTGLGNFGIHINSNGTITGTVTNLDLDTFLQEAGVSIPSQWKNSDIQIPYLSLTRYKGGDLSIDGELNANLQLFGESHFLGAKDARFSFQRSGGDTPVWTGSFSGTLELLNLDFYISGDIGSDTSFSIHLENQTLGSLLSYMLGFIGMPNIQFDGAWSILNDINLDNFIFTFDVTNKTVTLEYDLNQSFDIIQIDSFSLTYDSKATNQHKKVMFHIAGEFLGQSYVLPSANDGSQSTLGWSPSDPASAPQTPGASSVLDLRYLGIGQHLTLDNSSQLTSVSSAVDELKNAFQPANTNGTIPPGIHFDPQAGWLVGADFTLIDAISLSMVFDDPKIYGLKIALSGPKVKALAGLSFEILYKKVSDGLGEYSMKLKLPTAMRHISVGEASLTLPVIGLDIYTNSDFQVDFGFPYHNDFTQSFSIDVFPFAGQGGFYFGKIPASAVSSLPDTNGKGRFTPVIDFGFGLQAGVGFSASYGPLSVSADLGLHGIMQGIVSYFHPWESTYPDSFYFAIKADIGIQGWLIGKADFVIISASVNIDLEADAALNYIEYEPVQVQASAEVSASASIRFLFWTEHFSVHIHFNKTFTIHQGSTPPWASIPSPPASLMRSVGAMAKGLPTPPQANWNNGFTLESPLTLTAYLTPTITAANDAGNSTAKFVASFQLHNPNPINSAGFTSGTAFGQLTQSILAWTLSALKNESNWDTLKELVVTELELQKFLGWFNGEVPLHLFTELNFSPEQSQAIHHSLLVQGYLDKGGRLTGKLTSATLLTFPDLNFLNVTKIGEIKTLLLDFSQSIQWFELTDLENFFSTKGNVTFEVSNGIATANGGNGISVTLLPIQPSITITANGATQELANQPISGSTQIQYLNQYISEAGNTNFSTLPLNDVPASTAEYLFLDYFQLLATTALANAAHLIKAIPHTIVAPTDSLSEMATTYSTTAEAIIIENITTTGILNTSGWVALPERNLLLRSGATFTSLIDSLYQVPADNQSLTIKLAVEDLVGANMAVNNILQDGPTISFQNFSFTPQAETPDINAIATQFGVSVSQVEVFQQPLPSYDQALSAGTKVRISQLQFTVPDTGPLNTLAALSVHFGVSPGSICIQNPSLNTAIHSAIPAKTVISISNAWYIVPPADLDDIVRYFGISDSTGLNPTPGTPMTFTATYEVRSGDSLMMIANYLGIDIDTLASAVEGISITPGITINVPSCAVPIQAENTLGSLANGYNLSISEFALLNANSLMLFSNAATVNIPGSVSIETLIQKMDEYSIGQVTATGAAAVSQATNRFMKSGLRLPIPNALTSDTSKWAALPTYSLYALAGYQFDISNPGSITALSMSLGSSELSWLSIPGTNGTYAFSQKELALITSIDGALSSLTMPTPQQNWGWMARNEKFAFVHSTPWQSPENHKFLPPGNNYQPLIWMVPNSLQQSLQKTGNAIVEYSVNKGWWKNNKISGRETLQNYCWGCLFTLQIRPVSSVKNSSGSAGNLYTISVNDQIVNSIEELIWWLGQSTQSSIVPKLSILYKGPGQDQGLISAIATDSDRDTISVFSLKPSDDTQKEIVTLSNGLAALKEVIQNGYLEYQTATSPEGLPAYLFSGNPEGSVQLLVELNGIPSTFTLPSAVNCLLTANDINNETNVVYVTSDRLHYKPTFPLGAIGFEVSAFDAPSGYNAAGILSQLYQMLAYQSVDATGQPLGIESMPVMPSHPKGATGISSKWQYKELVANTPMKMADLSVFSATPSADNNPYAEITLNNGVPNSIHYNFHLRDLFGNRYQPAALNTVALDYLYNDTLLGLGHWPHVSASFDFSGSDASDPMMGLHFNFSAAKYLAEIGNSWEKKKRSILSDLTIYQKIYYQIHQPDIMAELRCSIGAVAEENDNQQGLLDTLQGLVKDIYGFMATLGYLMHNDGLAPANYVTQTNDTLNSVATSYNVDVLDLVENNLNVSGLFIDGQTINLPIVFQSRHGDSFASIQSYINSNYSTYAKNTSINDLVTLNANRAGLLSSGVSLSIPQQATPYIIQKGDTLSSIALAFGVTPSGLITTGNNATSKIISTGQVLIIAIDAFIFSVATNPEGLTSSDMTMLDVWKQSVAVNSSKPTPDFEALLSVNSGTQAISLAQGVTLTLPNMLSLNASAYQGNWVTTTKATSSLSGLASDITDQVDLFVANYFISGLLDSSAACSITCQGMVGSAKSQTLTIKPVINDKSSFATVYDSFITQLALELASLNGVGVQKTSVELSFNALSAPLTIDYSTSQPVQVLASTLKQQITYDLFVQIISEDTIVANNTAFLVPPKSISNNFSVTSLIPAHFSAITADITIERSPSLVSGDIRGAVHDLIQNVSSELHLHLSGSVVGSDKANHHTASNLSVKSFAELFQQLFPQYLVATAPSGTTDSKHLFAVPIGADSINLTIAENEQGFYLNPPLSTQVISHKFNAIQTYSSDNGLGTDTQDTLTVQSVDMDDWAQTFLKTFDEVLSPKNLATIQNNDQVSMNSLLKSRDTLISNITDTLGQVVAVSDTDTERLEEAKKIFRKQLEIGVSNAYRIDSVVQLKTNAITTSFSIPDNITLAQAASRMGISLRELVIYNINNQILQSGQTITIHSNPYPTNSVTNLIGWMNIKTQSGGKSNQPDLKLKDIAKTLKVSNELVILSNFYSNILDAGKSFSVPEDSNPITVTQSTVSLFTLMQSNLSAGFLYSKGYPLPVFPADAITGMVDTPMILNPANSGNPLIGAIVYSDKEPTTGTYCTITLTENTNLSDLMAKIQNGLLNAEPSLSSSLVGALPDYAAAEILRDVPGILQTSSGKIPANIFSSFNTNNNSGFINIGASDTLNDAFNHSGVQGVSFWCFVDKLSGFISIDYTKLPTSYYKWLSYTPLPKDNSVGKFFLENGDPAFEPEALMELGETLGILNKISTIGILNYSNELAPHSVSIEISSIGNSNPLVSLASTLESQFNLSGTLTLEDYMIGEAIRYASILASNPDAISICDIQIIIEDGNSLEDLYAQVNTQKYSFSYFASQIGGSLKFKSDVENLYFNWETLSDSVDVSGLTLEGPVNADVYTVSADANSLNGILDYLEKKYFANTVLPAGVTHMIAAEYLANVLRDEIGLLQSDSNVTIGSGSVQKSFEINSGESLGSFYTRIQSDSGLTHFTDFVDAIRDQKIMVPGKVLFLSWMSHGQPYTIASVAAKLGTDWKTLVKCNYNNAVAYQYSSNPQDSPLKITLANVPALWQTGTQNPVQEMPSAANNNSLLIPGSEIGLLTLGSIGDYPFYTVAGQNLMDFVNGIMIDTVNFSISYIAILLKNQTGLFQQQITTVNINNNKKTMTADQVLAANLAGIVEYFGWTNATDDQIGAFAIANNGNLILTNQKIVFKWTSVLDAQSNSNIADIANYFNIDNSELINANWNNSELLQAGITIVSGSNSYTTSEEDTFSNLASKLLPNGEVPDNDNFYNLPVIAQNRQLMSPFAQPGVLVLQPQTSLTDANYDLSNEKPYMTFAVNQSGEPERRIGLDFYFTAQTVKVASPNEPPQTYTLVSPKKYKLADVEVPIPLREFPGLPVLIDQNISPYSPISNSLAGNVEQPVLSIKDGRSWVYEFQYNFNGSSQDEIIIDVDFSASPDSQTKTVNYNEALFESLGNFIQVYPALSNDLSYLESVSGTTQSPAIKNAIEAFATLADQIAQNWQLSASGQTINSSADDGAFQFIVQELYDKEQQQLSITVQTHDQVVLPGDCSLPLILPDSTIWEIPVDLAPPGKQQLATYYYKLKEGQTPTGLRVVKFENQLDIINYHHVHSSLSVVRNANLLAGVKTESDFIFRTPSISFQNAIVPLIERKEEIKFFPNELALDSSGASLLNRIRQLFDEILPATASNDVQYAVCFGFNLSKSGLATIQTLVPLEMKSRVNRAELNLSALAAKITSKMSNENIRHGDLVFDIVVYSATDSVDSKGVSTGKKPILRLNNVTMPIMPGGIHKQRMIPFEDLNQLPWATDPDSINPLVTNISRFADVTINTATKEMLAYNGPLRIKSWTGGMIWNDNKTPFYYINEQIVRQVPIYADPLIGLYVAKLDTNYNDYFAQNGQTADGDDSVYATPTWEAGFHLSMPNPTMNNGAAYNSGTGLKTYNNDLLIYNAGNPELDMTNGDTWVAANYSKKPIPPFNSIELSDFSLNSEIPEGAFQSGLCQYGIWRDTLAINPVAKIDQGKLQLAFAPPAAKISEQGDFHAEFIMENETTNQQPINQQLRMRMALGSPYAQFTAAGIDGIRIEGIFKPEPVLDPVPKTTLTPGGVVHASAPAEVPNLMTGGRLNYVIIYQQVNLMHMEKIPSLGNSKMNWVAFAVYWDPDKISLVTPISEGIGLHILFENPAIDNYVVVAGLPSQMKNTFDASKDLFDIAAADAWAQKLGGYAFNWIQNTSVSYQNGQNQKNQPNSTILTTYNATLRNVGPVVSTEDTVFLLQPHQYLDPLNSNGTVLQPGSLKSLFAPTETAQGSYEYWISRGNLKHHLGNEFTISYNYPNLLPYLPSLPSEDKTFTPLNGKEEFFNLLEMTAALLGFSWVADFPDAEGEQQDGPATTGMADTSKMQDSYNASKTFYKASKIITMLYEMYDQPQLQKLSALRNISGPTQKVQNGWSIYSVGAVMKNGQASFFSPGDALIDFVDHLFDAFSYYFGGSANKHVARSMDATQDNLVAGKSYYYSYYDEKNHHLFVYPASGAGGYWPSNKDLDSTYNVQADANSKPLIFDGYGTVSALNDHAYTYGYQISAAALLGMIIQSPDLATKTFGSMTGINSVGLQAPISPDKINTWKCQFEALRPVIDQLIKDLAFDPQLQAEGIFDDLDGMVFPKMEFMDQWTGFSWTDGFPYNGLAGHNVNSPWEQMLAWTGIIYWGQATKRPRLIDMGTYLYTTALYNLEVYRYNVPQSYIPTSNGASVSKTGDYLPLAANDFLDEFVFYSGGPDKSGDSPYAPLTFNSQPFKGKTMWETMMSDSEAGTLNPSAYENSAGLDHRTAHVTYIYQGAVRCDNTYWNSALGMLSTSIYPQGANSLALSRNKSYMTDWLNAIRFQNKKAYYQLSYPTTINLLSALLGLNVTLEGSDQQSMYKFDSSKSNGNIVPIPGKLGDFQYSPQLHDFAKNPQENSFLYLSVNDQKTPFQWFWELCAGINDYSHPDEDNSNPPWEDGHTGETLSMYVPADKTGAEILQYLYGFSVYGTPVFNMYGVESFADTGVADPMISPMMIVWESNNSANENPTLTFMVYHTNSNDIVVSFYDNNGNLVTTTENISPYTLYEKSYVKGK